MEWSSHGILEGQITQWHYPHGEVSFYVSDCCEQELHRSTKQKWKLNNWNIPFRKAVQDWEMNHLMELLADVKRYNIDKTMADIMCWGRQGTFVVKDLLQEDWHTTK